GRGIHNEVLDLYRVQWVGQIVNRNRIVTGVCRVQPAPCVVDNGPTWRSAGIFHGSDEGEHAFLVITINGDLADGSDINVKNWQIWVRPHSESLMPSGLVNKY